MIIEISYQKPEIGVFLIFGLLTPFALHAAAPTYNFPATYSSGEQTTLSLPFDTLPTISALDLGDDGTSELLLGAPAGFAPEVRLLRQDGSTIASWFPYGEKFPGGVAAKAADLNGDGRLEIITAPLRRGGPHIKIFNTFGKLLNPGRFDPSEAAAMGALVPTDKAITIAIAKQGMSWQMTLPRQARALSRDEKTIIVDLSDQKLSFYQDGLRLATHPISTGRWGFPTPLGEFKVLNKIPRAYSRTYNLYMPFWMAFAGGGAYGIHELPEWPNGVKEGENHLGTPVSHGCIRLGVGPAEELYNWAEVGTRVIVQK